MSSSQTADSLARLASPVRRWTLLTGVTLGLGVALLGLAGGAWILRLRLAATGPTVLTVWALLLAGSGLVVGWWWRARRMLAGRAFAERLEALGVARSGALIAHLDPLAGGTSILLAAQADAARAKDLLRDGPPAVARLIEPLRRRVLTVSLGLLVGLTVLAAARPLRGTGRLLWQPGRALETFMAPLALTADRKVVSRGGSVGLTLYAAGQRSATLSYRNPGQPWASVRVALDSTGRADTTLAGLEADLHLLLSSGTRTSDTLLIRVRLPAFLGSLTLTARYPRYLRLDDETFVWNGEPVALPEGTVVETEGISSVALASAMWIGPGGPDTLGVTGTRLQGRWTPSASGEYQLILAAAEGQLFGDDVVRLQLTVVADSAPQVDLLVPGVDTLLPADFRVPLVADVRDDHGLARVELRLRRDGRSRIESQPMALPADGVPRALVTAALDLASWDLVAGDTVWYQVAAVDQSPAGRTGLSREFRLVVPTRADQREAQTGATRQAQARLDSLVDAAGRLQQETEALAAQRNRNAPAKGEAAMGFEEVRRAEEVAGRQDELIAEAEALQQTLDALREAVEQGGLEDSTLAARLRELSEQLARALSPELRQRLAELQQALKNLDPQAARDALQRLSEAQKELRDALARSQELFKRAALEGDLAQLEQTSKELAAEQRDWNEQVGQGDSTGAASQEDALAQRADSLAGGLDQAAGQMDAERSREAMGQSAEKAREAAAKMRQAAQSARKGERQQAREAGQSAESMMQEVGEQTEAQREEQQDAWREEVMRALDRALAETARLSREQLAVEGDFRRAAGLNGTRRQQAGIEESLQQVLEQVREVSGKNALVSPQIAVALVVARRHMAQAREAVSSASANPREAADQAAEAVDALNVAAFAMVRSRDDVGGAGSGSGMAEAMERMSQAAQQQGQMAQQAGSMLPQSGMSAIQMELQRMAARQLAMAQALERMRAEGQIPGAKELADEARELARRLDAGQLDRETVERQERLFRRMLDAGRTLEGEEQDNQKERKSTTAREGEWSLPPALARRFGGSGLRLPSWEELRRLPPEERRLITEYFRRISPGGAP